ncbi:hypothetical protein [Burkholderia paludis]|nr:hypothetical protein [Burkholderia paludis]
MTIGQAIDRAAGLPERYCTGRICVELEYESTSFGTTTRVRKFPLDATWFPVDDASFKMRVGDFSLPPELCCRGIGTLCWSKIHETLPRPPRDALILTGALSSKDAKLTGMIRGTMQTIDNLRRRNDFWLRMLAPGTQVLQSDRNGDGSFSGRFVDPARHANDPKKAIATKI